MSPAEAASPGRTRAFLLGAYLCVIVASLTAVLVWYPIFFPDSDLWFHLSTGKYIVEHLRLPGTSFFSFISPPRDWPTYFWLFQVFVHELYTLGGYPGLILFRAAMYLALMALVVRYLWKGQRDPAALPWLAFVSVLCAFILHYRYTLVRPHMFSYAFMAAFLYILEFHPRRAWILPLLGLVWCNLHGAVYPVMIMLTGAYALEYLVGRLRGAPYDAAEARRVFVPLVVTMATVYLTPLGAELIRMPFRPLGYQSMITSELTPFQWSWVTTIEIVKLAPSVRTCFGLLFLAACLSLLRATAAGRIRVSHLALFMGGLFLLPKAQRFTYEFALLSLPLLRSYPVPLSLRAGPSVPRRVPAAIAALALVMPFLTLKQMFVPRGRYPFSPAGLPEGVVAFLDQAGASGRILNHPNAGGYIRWALYPRYAIFMDMEVFFTDEDFYLGMNFPTDQRALDKVLARYDPSFIMVPLGQTPFAQRIASAPQYVPVFFDDAEALYVNRRHYPALADRYALHAIRPFEFFTWQAPLETKTYDDPAAFGELRRMLAVYPGGGGTNYAVADRLIRDGGYDRALPYAEAVIRTYPEYPEGHWLKGDALKGLGLFGEAERSYRTAIARASTRGRAAIYRKLSLLYFARGDLRRAYRLMKRGTDGLSGDTSIEELYALGMSAFNAGQAQEAELILAFLQDYKIPPEDTAWREKVAGALAGLSQSGEGAKRGGAPLPAPGGS